MKRLPPSGSDIQSTAPRDPWLIGPTRVDDSAIEHYDDPDAAKRNSLAPLAAVHLNAEEFTPRVEPHAHPKISKVITYGSEALLRWPGLRRSRAALGLDHPEQLGAQFDELVGRTCR